jgi:phage-related protein
VSSIGRLKKRLTGVIIYVNVTDSSMLGGRGCGMPMLKYEVLEQGKLNVILGLCTREGYDTLFDQFVEGLPEREQKKIQKAVERMSNYGPPTLPKKGRKIEGESNLYELKEYQSRVFWFRAGNLPDERGIIVLTHGFTKKSNRTPPTEIDRAISLREQYLERYGRR